MTLVPDVHARLARAIELQLEIFPDHRPYLEKRFANEDEAGLAFLEQLAGMVERVSHGDTRTIFADYHWLSGIMLEEELFFRRNGRYRLTSFADALEQVYANREYMARYMNGLLASQLWWRNHTEVMRYYRDTFLAGNPDGFTHLEVGPGHGLFLALALEAPGCVSAEGWDVSAASLANTREALDGMGCDPARIVLREVDIFAGPRASFQSITFSEVLEHLEEPLEALKALFGMLAPGGRIFVNAPVNSPAPDHLYLFRAPEEVRDMVIAAGFEIEDTFFVPTTGATLDRARRLNLTISAAVIGRKP